MANYNVAAFNKSAKEHNITGYQLIMGKSKGNVIGMLISGYQFDGLGTFTKLDVDLLMQDIVCNGAQKAYENHAYGKKSVAKQKVNEAHGRMDGERIVNFFTQGMTYADPFKNIQFIGQSWLSVLNQLVERESASTITDLNNWVKGMIDMHGSIAKAVIYKGLQTKQFRVLNHHVIPTQTFKNFLIKYCELNHLELMSDDVMENIINKYCDRHEQVIG